MLKSSILLELFLVLTITFSFLSAERTFPEPRGKILDRDAKPIMLSPVGGYLMKKTDIVEDEGKKGLQKYYNERLVSDTDLPTEIHSKLQGSTEIILDEMKVELNVTEVLAMVMDSRTGELITIASSNRYDPTYIRAKDVPSLNPKFSAYSFEPGAVMMPFTVAMSLNGNLRQRDKEKMLINTDFDKFQIGDNIWISDDTRHKSQTMTEILVNSSSIGAVQIAWEIPASILHYALDNYGFGQKSGIDLSRDLAGGIKTEILLEDKVHRANTAYGYGLMVTPIQLLKAYSMFTNNGMMVTPHIGTVEKYEAKEVLYKGVAQKVKQMLIEVVSRGTGKKAKRSGLTIGGKTGTAHIAENGKYTNKYNSTFFGFAEDNSGNSYTIGVLAIDTKAEKKYFASQSAVPTFGKIVDLMVSNNLLMPLKLKAKENNIIKLNRDYKTISPIKDGILTKDFGTYTDETYNLKIFNESITIQAPKVNSSVQNVLDGKVVFAGESKMLGNVVVVAHHEKMHTVYANLSEIASPIAVGTNIKKGYTMGKVEETLIFQVTKDSKHVNPLDLITL